MRSPDSLSEAGEHPSRRAKMQIGKWRISKRMAAMAGECASFYQSLGEASLRRSCRNDFEGCLPGLLSGEASKLTKGLETMATAAPV